MSSESSGEESDNDVSGYRKPVLKVKKLVWLQRKYRDAFHQIDRVYYQSHKSSRDKLKQRVQGDNSTREQPPNPHKFAVKFKFRAQDIDSLDTSLSASFSSELNMSTSSESALNSSAEHSPLDSESSPSVTN